LRRPDTLGLSAFWTRQPEGLDKGSGKSQVDQIGVLTCGFVVAACREPGRRDLRRCCRCHARAPRVPLQNPERCVERAKQRANGVRLRAMPTDSQPQSPQVDGSSGDAERRRNTPKIWFASRRPGVRVPLAPRVVMSQDIRMTPNPHLGSGFCRLWRVALTGWPSGEWTSAKGSPSNPGGYRRR